MGSKPAKYWDHRECGWVKCPAPADDVAVVPAQERPAEPVQTDGATAVGSAQ
jgi:hypothetical protein